MAPAARPPALRPWSALAHPLWLASLAFMVANDHVFKGSGLLPGWLTGKLSDVTGLLVAPLVLAVLLGVRSRRGWVAANVAVGGFLAAVNLSAEAAHGWAWLTEFTPLPWRRMVVDAGDLAALPALLVGGWVFGRAMATGPGALANGAAVLASGPAMLAARPHPRLPNALRWAALASAGVFLLGNETSEPIGGGIPVSGVSFTAPFGIGNGTTRGLLLRVRPLRKGVAVDCAAVKAKPGLLLSRRLFAPAAVWGVDSTRTIDFSRDTLPAGDCAAYLIDGGTADGLAKVPMTLAFWIKSEWPARSIPGTVPSSGQTDLFAVAADNAGPLAWRSHPALFAPPPSLDPGPAPGCELPGDATGVAWQLPLPTGTHTIVERQQAPDGCTALDLAGKTNTQRWFVCLPPGALPFDSGDTITLAATSKGQAFGPIDGVEITGDGKLVRLGRGNDLVYFGKGKGKFAPKPGCDGHFDACGALGVALGVELTDVDGLASKVLAPGQAAAVGKGRTLWVVRAQDQITGDPKCLGTSAAVPASRLIESVYVEVP